MSYCDYSDKPAEFVCADSGFLEYSDNSSAMFSVEDPTCSALKSMSLEKDDEEEVEISFKWSEVQNIGTLIEQSPECSYLQDVHGDTLLHKAIGYGNFDASVWLIELAPSSSYLDIQNDKSFTALHEAVACEETDIARKLILVGANPTVRTFSGNTALHIACLQGNFACAKALIEPLSHNEKCWRYQKTGVQSPMNAQNLELTNFQGKTCLHLAASNGYFDLVVLLVYSGADVNASEGMGGKTAIHLAIQNRHRDIVTFLAQEQPACMEVLTWSGYSVYQLALETDPQLAEELLRLGANPQLGRYDSSDYTDEDSMSDSSSDL